MEDPDSKVPIQDVEPYKQDLNSGDVLEEQVALDVNEQPNDDEKHDPEPANFPEVVTNPQDLELPTTSSKLDTQSSSPAFENSPYVPVYEPIQIHKEPHYPDFNPSKHGKHRKQTPDPKVFKHFEIDGEDTEDEEDGKNIVDVESDQEEKLDEIDAKFVAKNMLDKEVAEERKRKRRARGKVSKFVNNGLKLCFSYLPSTVKKTDFLDIVGPLPEYNYFYWNTSVSDKGIAGTTSAFINFVNEDDAWTVLNQFQNLIIKDNKGRDFYIRVSVAMFQEIANPNPPKDDPDPNPFTPGSIVDKEYFKKFLVRYEELNGVQGIVHNEDNTITPELMLKEIEENEELKKQKAAHDTPLTEFIKDHKAEEKKRLQRAREEAEAKEIEKLRQMRKERKKRKEMKEKERRDRKERERRERREKEKSQRSKERDKDKERAKDKGKDKDQAGVSESKSRYDKDKIQGGEASGKSKYDSENKESTEKPLEKKETPGPSKTLVFTNSKVKGAKESWSKQRSPREWGGTRRYDDEYSRSKPRRERDRGEDITGKYEGKVNRRSMFKPGSGSVNNDLDNKHKEKKDLQPDNEKPSTSSGVRSKDFDKSVTPSTGGKGDKPKPVTESDKNVPSTAKEASAKDPANSTSQEKLGSADKEPKKKIVKKIIKVKKGAIAGSEAEISLEGGKVAKVISKSSSSTSFSNKSKHEKPLPDDQSNHLPRQTSNSEMKSKDRNKDDADRRKRNRPDMQIYRPGRLRQDNSTNSASSAKIEEKNKESLSKEPTSKTEKLSSDS